VLYSLDSATLLKDPNLRDFLGWLAPHAGKTIEKYLLQDALLEFRLNTEKTLSYLESHLKLCLSHTHKTPGVDSIVVHSTHTFFKELLLQELSGVLSVPILDANDTKTDSCSAPLVVSFADAYTPRRVKELYELFRTIDGASFLTSYVIHRSFVIDGLFVPSKGTPCHFCFFSHWKSLEKARKGIHETSWYNYFQYVAQQHEEIPLSLPIERSDIGVLVSMIKKKLRWLITGEVFSTPFDPRAFTRYNLDDASVDADVIPHWPGCGCIAGRWA
jgi:McbB family protein